MLNTRLPFEELAEGVVGRLPDEDGGGENAWPDEICLWAVGDVGTCGIRDNALDAEGGDWARVVRGDDGDVLDLDREGVLVARLGDDGVLEMGLVCDAEERGEVTVPCEYMELLTGCW